MYSVLVLLAFYYQNEVTFKVPSKIITATLERNLTANQQKAQMLVFNLC